METSGPSGGIGGATHWPSTVGLPRLVFSVDQSVRRGEPGSRPGVTVHTLAAGRLLWTPSDASEFIKEACRSHLQHLGDDAAIAALRVGQLLVGAEASPRSNSEVETELSALVETVDEADLEEAPDAARDETADRVYGSDA